MCEKNIEVEQEEFAKEQECQEQLVDISTDERFIEMEIEKEIMRIDKEIIFDDESLAEMINSKNFQNGCNDASYYCAFYTSLINAGISNTFAQECVMNKMTCDFNLDLAKANNKASMEISKNQTIQIKNQEI